VLSTNVKRGLFEAHRVIYSFLIATSINRQNRIISETLWSAFLRGAGFFEKAGIISNPEPMIFTEDAWNLACYLDQTLVSFKGITASFKADLPLWTAFVLSPDPTSEKLPG
jgi:dynein heavy chain